MKCRLVDWVKHAFITKFHELPSTIYPDYTISLAQDMAQTRQETAFSDPSDLVAIDGIYTFASWSCNSKGLMYYFGPMCKTSKYFTYDFGVLNSCVS